MCTRNCVHLSVCGGGGVCAFECVCGGGVCAFECVCVHFLSMCACVFLSVCVCACF